MTAGTRILLVEDSPADAELIRELLLEYPEHSFSVRHAGSLAAALAALAEGGVDLVLLDLGLPDSLGMETVRAVRTATQGVPIVVLTGLDDQEVGLRTLHEGAQDYLIKGRLTGAALIRSIRYAGERHRVRTALIQKNAELAASKEELRERERRLRRAQEIANLGSWELADGRLSWSDELYHIHGVRPGEPEPTVAAFLASIHPDDRGRTEAVYSGSIRDGQEAYEIEYRIVRRSDGAVRTVYERGSHRRDADGRLVRSEGIVQDVTEWQEAQDTLRRYAAELERSNEELQRFAYVASHDLQEPLRAIVSFSQLLERRYAGKLDADADEYIGFIVEGGTRMQRLITDLLQLSRVTTQAAPIVETDAAEVVAGVVQTLAGTISNARATILVGPLPHVMADAVQLDQVFVNLIGNALKYCRRDCLPEITVSAERSGRMARFSVADNGIGIEAEYHDRIFEMFSRLHTHDQYEGTGIGLAVVKKIVERHGGRVWVESTPGEGSTFSFTLPAA